MVGDAGQEYYFADDDEEEAERAEARLNPMSMNDKLGMGGKAGSGGAVIRGAAPQEDEEDLGDLGEEDELSESELLAMGLEVDQDIEEDELELLDDDEDEEDEEEEDGQAGGGEQGGRLGGGFKLRPPAEDDEEEQPGDQQWGARGGRDATVGGAKANRAAAKLGRQQEVAGSGPNREVREPGREGSGEGAGAVRRPKAWLAGWLADDEEAAAVAMCGYVQGGDLRFRRSNLFTVANVLKDRSLLDQQQSFASIGVISPAVRQNLQDMGFTAPTTIQVRPLTDCHTHSHPLTGGRAAD